MNLDVYRKVSYRYDIQGVRAIGAILIMIYHIWFSKVSGGVDVFFVVSGYFMAGMLARSYLKNNTIKAFEFWGRIIRRVAPLSYTVIAATLVAGYFFMPPDLWRGGITEVLTSALDLENWDLIRGGANYLASSNLPSPLQQFWALSLQVQFYLLLPLVLFVGIALSKLAESYKAVFIFVVFIVAVSFGFSIYYTNTNPSAAYFHTGARAWEFFIGVAIFLISPFICFPVKLAGLLTWIGFLLLFAVGVIVPKSAAYPGYIAVLPVAAAGMIILAGAAARTGYVYKLLSSKALVYIGGISFSLYLWHWPILIYFQHYFGINVGEITLVQGLLIIILAFVFSIISNTLIEKPFANIKKSNVFAPYIIGLAFFSLVFFPSYYVRSEMVKELNKAETHDYVGGDFYSGDSAYVQKGPSGIGSRRLFSVSVDSTSAYLNDCSVGLLDGEIYSCEFGDTNSENSILMVGGSRLAHWEPFFSYMGKKDNFKVVTATMNGCSFGYHYNIENNIECQDWNNKIIDFIAHMEPKPKVVIVNSSRSEVVNISSSDDKGEYTPTGYLNKIKEVLFLGIPVIGLRVNPKFNDPVACLWRNNNDASKCATNYLSSLEKKNPIVKIKEDEGLNDFYPVDFTSVLCGSDGLCPAAFNGYPALRDNRNHFTKSYILYLSKTLEKSLNNQVGGFLRFLKD